MHPILFNLGPYAIRSYTVALGLAVLVGTVTLIRQARREGEAVQSVLRFCAGAALFALVGARLCHAVLHPAVYTPRPAAWLTGGLMAPGALAGTLAWTVLVAQREQRSALYWLDLIAPVIPLAEAVLRLGCLLNGCCYGRETTSPLGLYLPGAGGHWAYRFPTQMAYFMTSLLIFALISRQRKDVTAPGSRFWPFLGLYALEYGLLDFWRADARPVLGPITPRQAAAIVAGVAALVGWLRTRHDVPAHSSRVQTRTPRRSWLTVVFAGLAVLLIVWTLGCGYRSVTFDVQNDGGVNVTLVFAAVDDGDESPDCNQMRSETQEEVRPDAITCTEYANPNEALAGCECRLRYDQRSTFNQNFQLSGLSEEEAQPALTPELTQLSGGHRLNVSIVPGLLWSGGTQTTEDGRDVQLNPMELSVRMPGPITSHDEPASDVQTTLLGSNEIRWAFPKAAEDHEGQLRYVLSVESKTEEHGGNESDGGGSDGITVCPSALPPLMVAGILLLIRRNRPSFSPDDFDTKGDPTCL